jgi:outer membrane protein assembly factor BamA
LEPGEIHNPDKIWDGIKSIERLYISKGYIDTTAGVTMSVDHSERLVDVFVEVREGKQYRVGTVKILGLTSKTMNLLRSIPKPGQIFDSRSVEDFLEENKDVLPVDASENDVRTLPSNSEDGTAEILFDFRRCSTP